MIPFQKRDVKSGCLKTKFRNEGSNDIKEVHPQFGLRFLDIRLKMSINKVAQVTLLLLAITSPSLSQSLYESLSQSLSGYPDWWINSPAARSLYSNDFSFRGPTPGSRTSVRISQQHGGSTLFYTRNVIPPALGLLLISLKSSLAPFSSV